VQQPSPPIAIGGGARKILELAARQADIVCFNRDNRAGKVVPDGALRTTADATLEKVAWVRDAAGDRFDRLQLEIGAYHLSVTDDTAGAVEKWARRLGIDPDDVLAHPHVFIGSVDRICDVIEERRARYGISYYTVLEHDVERFAPVVERLSGQ
jgi:alkanesulfonate monooxygenase SsuD/methylene tetrahydromethanopterin reductase-like flavin-dependent oxidoreductase (luciferase family)